MLISDWSSDVCSSDLGFPLGTARNARQTQASDHGFMTSRFFILLCHTVIGHPGCAGKTNPGVKYGLDHSAGVIPGSDAELQQAADSAASMHARGQVAFVFRYVFPGVLVIRLKIGRASCRKACVSTCRSRWSPVA